MYLINAELLMHYVDRKMAPKMYSSLIGNTNHNIIITFNTVILYTIDPAHNLRLHITYIATIIILE